MGRGSIPPSRRRPWWQRLLRMATVGVGVVAVIAWRERKFAQNQQRYGLP
ncbi:MAG: hypothetical protein KY454_03495 [Actinobacteria bacterium]|nr:hypothetical protein [Actinomycetota bacterium]MBW3649208.1 hypothetical protein [Actinomycetota bacterium]